MGELEELRLELENCRAQLEVSQLETEVLSLLLAEAKAELTEWRGGGRAAVVVDGNKIILGCPP